MSGRGGHVNQVAPIVVCNPSDSSETSEGNLACKCCGEACRSHGMCFSCAQVDCSHHLEEPCTRTGAVDPLELAVPEETELAPEV